MAKYVKQFRFYRELSDDEKTDLAQHPDNIELIKKIKNYPYDITMDALSTNSENLFRACLPIQKLGIQALPGTKFYLNFSPMTNPIIIGATGRFELDLTNSAAEITSLYFEKASLERINKISSACLIVDMVCEEG